MIECQHEFNEEFNRVIRKYKDAAASIVGKKVRVLSDYNGQLYGSSKPSLKGKIFTIKSASVCDSHGLIIAIDGYEYGSPYLCANEWEFIDTTK